ncbi:MULTISPECIES: DinB family protein [Emticicia]|uniref:DinB family protein n=1 Tax=Emticicia TaxID=312278 RepID=UPI0007D8B043|nr:MULTISPECIES: DinB family protein [Emticicia]
MEKLSLLNLLESQVENHLQLAIEKFQNLSEESLLMPSSSRGWSIAQCLEHLNTYGVYYLPLFEKCLAESKEESSQEFLKSTWLGKLSIDSMNPEKGKRKFKAMKGYIPSQNLEADRVVAEFINQQERLLLILREAAKKNIQRIKIPISIAKFLKLNLGDALQFLIIHNERHMQQALRNL